MGLARAADSGGWHHIDIQGNPAYDRRFKFVEPFYNGQARVEEIDGSLLVIGESGQTILVLHKPTGSEFHALSHDLVGFWKTQTLRAAVELGIIEYLPATTDQVGERASLNSIMTERLLRALAALGIVARHGDGVWQLRERGAMLTQTHATSLASAATLWGREHYSIYLR